MIDTSIKHILLHSEKFLDQKVKVCGWIRTHRKSKNISFIEVNDGSNITGLQTVIEPELEEYKNNIDKLNTGASVELIGVIKQSQGSGQSLELLVSELKIIGECSATEYPLQKKGHTLEFLRENLHLRGRSNTIGAVMRVRSKLSFLIHKFFNERGFFYLNAPVITTLDCEGAGEMFKVTTEESSKSNGLESNKEFFGEKTFLTVSGQLQAESYASSLGRVYTFGPTFRAENSNTTRHLAEFWMIEPEMAFYDLNDNMALAEECLRYLISETLKECEEDLIFLHKREWASLKSLDSLKEVASVAFQYIEYTEAVEILLKSKQKFEYKVEWGIDLQTEHERYLTDVHFKAPIIVINYPKNIKAFYMRLNDDNKTVRAMDVLVPRLGEIIGGSQREERIDVLKERMIASNINIETYNWYLELRKFGTVPHSGFGLGFERLLMYITGITNIRDAIPFPRFPGNAKG